MHEPRVQPMEVASSELILGGQKSGKSRRAQDLAEAWLATGPGRRAVLIATAVATDEEMRQRIARHQSDRAGQLPSMVTLEEPHAVADSLRAHADAHTLIVVDCLTLWLTNMVWPAHRPLLAAGRVLPGLPEATEALLLAILAAPGPVVLVSNEIGLGVIPMGREVRGFVDALGLLNQRVARACARVTLMSAGLPLALKAAP